MNPNDHSRLKKRSSGKSAFAGVRTFLRWGFFLTIFAAFVGGLLVYRRGSDQIRDVASKIFQRQFPSLQVSFDTIRLDSTRGVRLSGVQWKLPNAPSTAKPFLEAETIYVECPVDLQSFLAGNFKPKTIVVDRPRLRVGTNLQETLDQLRLLQPANSGDSPCDLIEIVDGSVTIQKPDKETTISEIHVSLTPAKGDDQAPTDSPQAEPAAQTEAPVGPIATRVQVNRPTNPRSAEYTACNTQVRIRPMNYEEPSAKAAAPEPSDDQAWIVQVEVSNPLVESLSVSGRVDSNSWSFSGAVNKLDLSSTLDLTSEVLSRNFSFLNNLQGKTSLDFEASGSVSDPSACQYKIEGAAVNCALATPVLKYPLSEIEMRYVATADSASIEKFTAHCGLTSIKAAYRQSGSLIAPNSASFRVRLSDFPLRDELLTNLISDAKQKGALSPSKAERLANFLSDYQFAATTNVDATIEKSAATKNEWSPVNLEIEGTDVEFVYRNFPYRIDQLSGRVALDSEGSLSLALRSSEKEPKTSVSGRFLNALSAPRGQIDVIAKDRAIDEKLILALPEASRPQVQSLNPSGTLDAKVRVVYDKIKFPKKPLRIETSLDVRDGSVQYKHFPLPISAISGSIYLRDEAWALSDFSGKCGAASLVATGSLVSGKALEEITDEFRKQNAGESLDQGVEFGDAAPGEELGESPAPLKFFASLPIPSDAPLVDDAKRFQLTTDVQNFPLGEELTNALVEYENKDEFEKLHVDGKANGEIRVAFRTDTNKLAVEFEMKPTPGSTSAQPDGFPYEFKDIDGQFSYRAGALSVEGLRAKSGRTTFSADVNSRTASDGSWALDITSLRVDQVQIDRDLQSASPNQALAFLTFLNPSGSLNVDGAVRIVKRPGSDSKAQTSWALRFVAQQNAARPIVQLDAICGSVKCYGATDSAGKTTAYGEFDLDSLYYKDLQITKFVGPFYYDGSDVFWGREAPTIRRTALYQNPFLRQRIDADPIYETPGFSFPSASQNAQAAQIPQAAPRRLARAQAPVPEQKTEDSQFAKPSSNAANALQTTQDGRRSLQAQVFDGIVLSDGVFSVKETPTYRFNVSLNDGLLEDFSRYFAPGSKPLKGRIGAHASLQGEGYTTATLKGSGDMNVQDAALYELPQIVKIFQILSVKEPDQSAFSTANAQFQVLGDRLKITNVSLEGDALTLFGDGWVTLRGQDKLVDLTLNSRLGNASTQIPIVSDVIGEVGDQLTQIRVEGNLRSPIVHQEAAPGVKKAWWSVFPEREPEPDDKAPEEKSRPIRDAWKKLIGGSGSK